METRHKIMTQSAGKSCEDGEWEIKLEKRNVVERTEISDAMDKKREKINAEKY